MPPRTTDTLRQRLLLPLALALLSLTTIGQSTPATGQTPDVPRPNQLLLESPLDYQVFQRGRPHQGEIAFRAVIPAGCDHLEITILSNHPQQPPIHRRLRFRTKSATRTFEQRIMVPAGGWYRCELRGFRAGASPPIFESDVEHVGVGDVFVIAGQSNSANHGSHRQEPQSGWVTAFDGTRWRPAKDPQPGASGDGGSFIPAFGDAVAARTGLPVGVISIGAGGTSVREWLPRGDRMSQQPTTGAHVRQVGPHTWEATGELFERLAGPLQHLGPHGCRAVLWHQGESDAGQARSGYPADRQITGDQYVAFMRRLITASRDRAGWRVPWFTAQATYHSESDPADAEFRAAQARLWETGWAKPGPDTDALRAEYRDGVHFNERGLHRHGELWARQVLSPSRSR
ncbi:MAG: hypothetical protein IT581_13045 [Verrucomicrobiales bacterium]|nr:hypothetical protein [Verrucomicrobiales bacterium]